MDSTEVALPLLRAREQDRGQNQKGASRWRRHWVREAGRVSYLALPMLVASLSRFAVQMFSNMMVGHLPGVLPLSAAAIATSLATVSGFSLLIGMASALETLCGQAYGAKQYRKLAVHTYRAIFTLLTVCVPLSLLWLFMGKILVLLGQDPLISQEAGRYIVWLIPGLFAIAVTQPITRLLQSQSLVLVLLLSSSCKETRTVPTMEAFQGVGLLPNPELQTSVLSICFTSTTLLFSVPSGLGAAGSTRVANELGAGNPEGARSAVRVVLSMAVMDAVILGGTLLASRHLLGAAYSSEEEVISFVADMVPLVCITVVTDALQGVFAGIARGSGWQDLGVYVNLGSFYLLGIPMAILLGFVLNMGGRGLWMGVVCGSVTQITLQSAITFSIDWTKMAEKARERVFNEKQVEPLTRGLLE